MKKIVGLDLGTNSIGWSVIEHDFENKTGKILGMGSRILPMGQDMISDFNKGVIQSSAALRTHHRGVRRLRERELLRRERLLKVLKRIGWVEKEYEVNHLTSFAYNSIEGKNIFKFKKAYLEMKNWLLSKNESIEAIPFDWTLYYLRVKALNEALSTEELVWVLMSFNQKRGYFQVRGDEVEKTDNTKYFVSDIVSKIIDTGNIIKGKKELEIHLTDGIVGIYQSSYIPDWINKSVDFLVSERKLKDGTIIVTLSAPGENDWTLRKKKIESELTVKNETVAQRILNAISKNPHVKIRGKEVHTIDRSFYVNELKQILHTQEKFHNALTSVDVSKEIAQLLYKSNITQQHHVSKQTLSYILLNDIIYYQRPLKSKKSLIENCKYESRSFIKDDVVMKQPIKAAPKSHPIFQEYRIWSLIHNIRITQNTDVNPDGQPLFDIDVTAEILDTAGKEKLYELFDQTDEISTEQVLKKLGYSSKTHSINYEKDKKLKGNELKSQILKAYGKANIIEKANQIIDNTVKLEKIWHMLYSLSSRDNLKKALQLESLALSKEEIEVLCNLPPFSKGYGSLSVKAMKKLLSVMRVGKYWSLEEIDQSNQILKNLLSGELDDNINNHVGLKFSAFTSIEQCSGMPEYFASYAIYGRHSEISENIIYTSPLDIKLLKQHSLRNPIVEKVINEALLVMRDVWIKYGKPDEIHVETGRELKLPNDKRKTLTQKRDENEATNKRARLMLRELKNENSNINPYSIGHIEQFKLFEEGSLHNYKEIDEEIIKISKKSEPTQSEINRYKLWLEQRYLSPYTGQVIPLSKLFTSAYEVEHIIPRSLYFDDSMNNKVICEAEVNKEKDKMLAYNFIDQKGGSEINISGRGKVKILDRDNYINLVNENFFGNHSKKKNLLAKEIPNGFIARQLNDSRYISKKIMDLLDPIVREAGEVAMRSKNIISMVGSINASLRQQWGLAAVWKEMMVPRFQRLQEIDPSNSWYEKSSDGSVHLNLEDVDIKRLDHRHHALDALIAACVSRHHIQYLNALNNEGIRYELEAKLIDPTKPRGERAFVKPWKNFTIDAKSFLESTIASFKTNNKIISKTKNIYEKYVEENGKLKKSKVIQKPNPDFWAIRKALHKQTVYGKVKLKEYKTVQLSTVLSTPHIIANKVIRNEINKLHVQYNGDLGKIKKHLKDQPLVVDGVNITKVDKVVWNDGMVASRSELNDSITLKNIESITDSGIKKELKKHLEIYGNDIGRAFSSEGLEAFNAKRKIPIYKVRISEEQGKKYMVGSTSNKSKKFVEAEKGTNMFFVIYKNLETGEHVINEDSTIGFGDIVALSKNKLPLAPDIAGHSWFSLSPGDIVKVDSGDTKEYYKVVSFTKQQCFFIPVNTAISISDKIEYTSLNKFERNEEGIMIKSVCQKMKINRLGEIE